MLLPGPEGRALVASWTELWAALLVVPRVVLQVALLVALRAVLRAAWALPEPRQQVRPLEQVLAWGKEKALLASVLLASVLVPLGVWP